MEFNKDQLDMTFQLVLERDSNTCALCSRQLTSDKMRLHVMDSNDDNILDRSVVLCSNCNTRIVKRDPERMKILFWPYVHRNEILSFNKKHIHKLRMLK